LQLKKIGFDSKSLFGISKLQISSNNLSILTPCCAEIGMIGEFSAVVPLTNSFISL